MDDAAAAKRLWERAVDDPESVGTPEKRRRLARLLASDDPAARRRAADAAAKLAYAAPRRAADLRSDLEAAARTGDARTRDHARRALDHVDDRVPTGGGADGGGDTEVYDPGDGDASTAPNRGDTEVFAPDHDDGSGPNFCPHCGADLRGQSARNFCGGCGHEL